MLLFWCSEYVSTLNLYMLAVSREVCIIIGPVISFADTLKWEQELNYWSSSKNWLRRMLRIYFRYICLVSVMISNFVLEIVVRLIDILKGVSFKVSYLVWMLSKGGYFKIWLSRYTWVPEKIAFDSNLWGIWVNFLVLLHKISLILEQRKGVTCIRLLQSPSVGNMYMFHLKLGYVHEGRGVLISNVQLTWYKSTSIIITSEF